MLKTSVLRFRPFFTAYPFGLACGEVLNVSFLRRASLAFFFAACFFVGCAAQSPSFGALELVSMLGSMVASSFLRVGKYETFCCCGVFPALLATACFWNAVGAGGRRGEGYMRVTCSVFSCIPLLQYENHLAVCPFLFALLPPGQSMKRTSCARLFSIRNIWQYLRFFGNTCNHSFEDGI